MRTGLHQNDAVAQIAEVVGSPDVTRVNFYEDYVIVRRAPRRAARRSTRTCGGTAALSVRSGRIRARARGLLFDASTVDFSIIPSLITIAKRDSGMNDADDYYPSVSRAPAQSDRATR